MNNILKGKGEIYLVSCIPSGKQYIGQAQCFKTKCRWGTEKRWNAHVHNALYGKVKRCTALCNAIIKYGADAFTVKTIFICDIDKLNYFETKYIRQYNTLAPNGYNLKLGGSVGRWSDESKKRLSEAKKGEGNCRFGIKLSDEVKARIGNGNKGKVRSDNLKFQMSEDKKYLKPENVGLPRYIFHYRSKGLEGYKIFKHPLVSKKIFTSKSKTMDEKLQQAISYLEYIESEGGSSTRR